MCRFLTFLMLVVAVSVPIAHAQERPRPQSATPGSRPSAATGSALTAQEVDTLVRHHNRVRAEVKVRPLAWAPRLAAVAQQWADRLAQRGDLEHRPNSGPSSTQYGENLAIASTVLEGSESWYSERGDYEPGAAVTRANFSDIGHYTQMVWRSTTTVGCGKASVPRGQYRGQIVLVCNYDPAGNFLGQKPF